jgi:hypothetical protein
MSSGIRLTAALACLIAPALLQGQGKIYIVGGSETLAVPATDSFVSVPAPSVRMRSNEAQATTAPWIEANGWRFERGLKKVRYDKLPPGSAVPAAAEAFAYGVDAILNPDPADRPELTKFLEFLNRQEQEPLPVMANIGVVDDKSPAMDEVLNMLTRRNLLYRVLPSPGRKFDLTVQLGSKDFPKEAAQDPSDFAARVRAKLGDDRRLVRVYGSSTVIAHLTGDDRRVRLFLLSYARPGGRGQGGGGAGALPLRVRLLGHYRPVKFSGYGAAQDAELTDIENPGNATEFSVPSFNTLAIMELNRESPSVP